MREAFGKVWANPYVQVLVYLLSSYLLYRLVHQASSAVFTLVWAFLFAYLTHPVVRFFERRRLGRGLGVVAVYLGFFLFLGVFSLLVVQTLAELSRFLNELPRLLSPLLSWAEGVPDRVRGLEVPEWFRPFWGQAVGSLQGLLDAFLKTLLSWFQALLQGGGPIGFFAGLLGGAAQLFAALALSAYLLYDFPRIGRSFLHLFPRPYQGLVEELGRKLDASVGGYIRGQVLVAFLVGLTVGVGFSLVGLPLALPLAFLAGVFNLIPFVGVIISGVPALLLALPLGLHKVLAVLVVLWVANQLEAHLFAPLIVGRATRLHPVTAVAAILIGASLLGLWGALLAVPTAAFLKVLLQDYYTQSRFYEDG
ncbi:MAG: AI-2E family transporter [Thermaceae bacterium]